jgi:hypothetical protein
VVVPLSFDGTKPQGFLSQFQAKKVDERTFSLRDMLPSFLKRDKASGLDIAIRIVGSSTNYLDAEENFAALSPHVDHLSEAQIKVLLERSAANEQVQHAGRCAKEFLPPLLRSHGNLLEPSIYEELRGTCERYGAKFG